MEKNTNTLAEEELNKQKTYGVIKKAKYFSEIIGTCTIKDDETGVETEFRLEIGAFSRAPIVMNENNGKSFALTWEDLVNMAIDYGILKDEPVEVEDVKTD